MSEFVEGFEAFSEIGPAVAFFGSARAKSDNPYYKAAEKTAWKFAKAGYAVITGAGSGIMEAANKGAYDAKGESIGLNILIPIKQVPNKYITKLLEFKYFFCRKVMFSKYSKACIVFPGGYGTLDELAELLALIQTQRIEPLPIVLYNEAFWQGLIDWFTNTLIKKKTISKEDMKLFKFANTPQQVLTIVENFYQ
jgi:hypothetical protein